MHGMSIADQFHVTGARFWSKPLQSRGMLGSKLVLAKTPSGAHGLAARRSRARASEFNATPAL